MVRGAAQAHKMFRLFVVGVFVLFSLIRVADPHPAPFSVANEIRPFTLFLTSGNPIGGDVVEEIRPLHASSRDAGTTLDTQPGASLKESSPWIDSSDLKMRDEGGGRGHGHGKRPPKEDCGFHPLTDGRFAVVCWSFFILYLFYALANICDEYFVPALQIMSDRMSIPDDVAGATLMAIGASSPELFTNCVSIFITKSPVGVGTIVGSEIFNMLMICGCSALCSVGTLQLNWRPLSRDVFFYAASLGLLGWVLQDGVVSPMEALALFCSYLVYALVCIFFSSFVSCFCPESRGVGLSALLLGGIPSIVDEEQSEATSEESVKEVTFDAASPGYARSGSEIPVRPRAELEMSAPSRSGWLMQKDRFHGRMDRLAGRWSRLWFVLREDSLMSSFHCFSSNRHISSVSRRSSRRWSLPSVHASAGDHMQTNVLGEVPLARLRLTPNTIVESVSPLEFQIIHHKSKRRTILRARDPGTKSTWMESISRSIACITEQHHQSRTLDAVPEEDAEEDGEAVESHLWTRPKSLKGVLCYVVTFPLKLMLFLTIPDVKQYDKEKYYPLAFLVSMIWLAICSFFMCVSADALACLCDIPPSFMGLTLAAVGTSFPNLVSSLLVAKQGLGNMAVSNAFGSNVFNIFFALGLPWAVRTWITNPGGYVMDSSDIFLSVIILAGSLLAFVLLLVCTKFRLPRWLGVMCVVGYVCFLVFEVVSVFL